MAFSGAFRLSQFSTLELSHILKQKSIHGEDRSACVQGFKNTRVLDKFEELVGPPACNSARLLLGLVIISTRFLATADLARRANMENVDFETYAWICIFRDMTNVSILETHVMNRS